MSEKNGNTLRKAQVRILKALAGVKTGTKAEICAKVAKEFPTAAKFTQWMADPLGSLDPKVSKAAEKRCGYRSLLTLGYVQHHELVVDDRKQDCFSITSKGRSALKAALAEAKAK